MLLHHIGRPSVYLPTCTAIWGIISISTGFASDFVSVLCARFFLGFVEAAFFPGALFVLSKWYTRHELSARTALLFSGLLISNAYGALIASGALSVMDGVWGFAAWRWLFFLEGFVTVIVAIIAMFIVPDFPENSARWLTPLEQSLAVKRMIQESGSQVILTWEDGEPKPDSVYTGLELATKDWKVWWLSLTFGFMSISLSFNGYFPTLMASAGYSPTVTLLLCAPPWIFSTVISLVVSRHSDHYGERCWHTSVPFLVGFFGFIVAITMKSWSARYISFFMMAQSYAGCVCFLAWASGSTTYPSSKRAVALGMINSGAVVGNIVGAYLWPESWGSTYSQSYSICALAAVLAVGMCLVFRRQLQLLNKETWQAGGQGHIYLL